MSLGELAMVAVIAIVCLKPEDAPYIIKTFKDLRGSVRRFIFQLEKTFLADLDEVFSEHDERTSEELNFYLAKIAELGGKYEGDYSLQAVREHYYSLLAHNSEEKSGDMLSANRGKNRITDKKEN